jgi:hypothetical protein
MHINHIPHYIKKIIQLGPRTSFVVAKNRLQVAWHEQRIRRKALNGTAAHSWPTIASQHNIDKKFSLFWQQQKNKSFSFLDQIYADQPIDQVIAQAHLFEQKTFDLLGSGPTQFSSMPWHIDFRLQAQNKKADCVFDKTLFYKDIQVQSGMTDELVKDIKVPWELSRCQHLLVLGQAYAYTKDERYAKAFVEHVSDWIQENPYLLGANWVCPMDVGIRALNWICAFHFFKNSATISESFWQPFVSSLYDHCVYLENNWEIYDGRTSNHYLSDLVGYLYLCSFFDSLSGAEEKMIWCRQEIMREFEKQVFDDGTDYEGSTKYHGLVTELFYHAYLVTQHVHRPFPHEYEKKLRRMFDFIAWSDGIQVGDNDSGKILYYGITPSWGDAMRSRKSGQDDISGIKTFPYFGLSFFRSPQWQVSLRHHAYNKRQPSGHFHNDVGSITVSVRGIPVIVDPGSYLYTPSSFWRNYFRSVQHHNTFALEGVEPVKLDERLFALDMPEHRYEENNERLVMSHTFYPGSTAHREIVCSDQELVITDWWQGDEKASYQTEWNFVLAPEVEAVHEGDNISLYARDKKVLVITSDLNFGVADAWYAECYGKRIPCKKLQARKSLNAGEKIFVVLR